MADASGLFLKAKMGRYEVKFINEKIILMKKLFYVVTMYVFPSFSRVKEKKAS